MELLGLTPEEGDRRYLSEARRGESRPAFLARLVEQRGFEIPATAEVDHPSRLGESSNPAFDLGTLVGLRAAARECGFDGNEITLTNRARMRGLSVEAFVAQARAAS